MSGNIKIIMAFPEILKDKYTAWLFGGAAAAIVMGFVIAAVQLWDVQSVLVLHFDAFRGADFFGKPSDVFDILMVGLIVCVINAFLAERLYTRERFLSYVLAFGTVLLSLLILIAVGVIISIN